MQRWRSRSGGAQRAMSALPETTTLLRPSPAAMWETPVSVQTSRRERLISAAMAPFDIGAAASMAGDRM